ncbi:MAG: glucosaminidase domain-containing protein [Paludibacteraceae bacterium]|nr:glucosaminidase domain-containing protein [Paludibacteraceae bacterium]
MCNIKILAAAFLMQVCVVANALEKNSTYVNYISKYNKIAVEEMRSNGVPASITLAQGLLESGAGLSELAKKSNNHFGIKCHNEWTGERVYHDDDKRQECFRKYDNPEQSFVDHSLFLKKVRYASLFTLDPTDYKGWAKGLKKCGYATEPRYAERLIDLIETYELYKYDQKTDIEEVVKTVQENQVVAETEKKYLTESAMGSIPVGPYHKVVKIKGRKAIEARKGDTYETLAKEFGMRPWELRWANRAKRGDTIEVGSPVYLRRW